jgi:hypothetical protein
MIDSKAELMSTETTPGSGQDGRQPFMSATVDGFPGALDALAEDGAAGTMAPGAVLTALADRACDPAVLGTLTDDQLLGVVSAGRRLAGHAAWIQRVAAAEFAARHREPDAKKATPLGFAPFSPDELVPELVVTTNSAELFMAQSSDAARRLPANFVLLRDGKITEFPMEIIIESTQCLSDEDAAEADRLVAAMAPGLTTSQLRKMCTRTVMMIDPKAAGERKKTAAKEARVTRFQEYSGNAAISGRELPSDEVLAASQHVDAIARALREAGVPGTLQYLRSVVYLDLLQGTDPLTRLATPDNATDHASGTTRAGDDLADWSDQDESEDEGSGSGNGDPHRKGARSPGERAPVRAAINLLVPVGTLLGWSSAPGEIPDFGLLDPQTTRDMTEAASLHPETRWCLTIIGPDGTAIAHGCAPGQHPWHPTTPTPPQDTSPPGSRPPPRTTSSGITPAPGPGPPAPGPGEASAAGRAAQATQFVRQLKADLSPIARDSCDHRHYSGKYVISRKVKHLIKARKTTCIAPCCNRPAADADADHTIPWPGGPSCECNLGAPCRYHHRNKQAVGWHLEQPEPGVFKWRTPSGRTHTTYPTKYII